MGFGDVFGETWKDYKVNFKAMSQLQLAYYIFPSIIIAAILIGLFFWMGLYDGLRGLHESFLSVLQGSFGNALNSTTSMESDSLFKPLLAPLMALVYKALPFIVLAILLGIASSFLTLFGYTAIAASAVKKKTFRFSEAVLEAKKYFWKVVGLILFLFFAAILYFFTVLLFAALFGVMGLLVFIVGMVVAIWAVVLWIFAFYFIVGEGKGVFASLRASARLVKGRWWKTLGYFLLFSLITTCISFIFTIIQVILQAIFLNGSGLFSTLGIEEIVTFSFDELMRFFFISGTISGLVRLLSNFILIPLGILFMKNMYLAWKKAKR